MFHITNLYFIKWYEKEIQTIFLFIIEIVDFHDQHI